MNKRATLPIEAAKRFAKAAGLEELQDAVLRAEEAAWDVVTIMAEETATGYDIRVDKPTGVMVAWFLPSYEAAQLGIPGGEPAEDLHVTLAYLGDATAMSVDEQRKLIGVVGEVCQRHPMLDGALSGVGRFSNGEETDPFWVGVDIPGLQALRADLVEALTEAGIELAGIGAGRDYTPHVTVAYIPAEDPTPPITVQHVDAWVGELTVAIGPARHRLSLQVPQYDGDDGEPYNRSAYIPDLVTKSAETREEDRFTLGPWYIPGQLDAHDEWTDAESIQKALWGYVQKDDRDIRLQHNLDVVAGEWVEAVTWPFPVEVPLTSADGIVTKYKYPAGTPFLGVQWEPWAWELVKAGKLSGYSIGGKGGRILADLPEA